MSTDVSPVKEALLALEAMQAELSALKAGRREPIAIVGLGCRLPAGPRPAAFWQALRTGTDAISEVPADRWDLREFFDPNPAVPGKMTSRWGGFVTGVDGFDAHFFGISRREAESVDPQHRLLLEVTWEALEDAGLPASQVAGMAAGVFVGICTNDYYLGQFADASQVDAYAGAGNASSLAANRLSYFLDLKGPSMAVDTACSSSLVATHLAVQSLRAEECDLAIAAGVNLIIAPHGTVYLSKAGMMSPDGRCKTLDARADGYVRGEGCGVVVLKRLSDALADGDRVLAVIRGSAVNQDGRSNGITAPTSQAQEAVIRRALANSGVSAADIDLVELHGTGTALGDPIEYEAVERVYGAPRSDGRPCLLGSVKANIGHLEGAAGVAGLIKAVLAVAHAEVPPQLHFRTLNPRISLEGTPFRVPLEPEPWPHTRNPRRAAVSSFGLGGTNAHVIVEQAPPVQAASTEPVQALLHLPVSARSEPALRELSLAYARLLSGPAAPPLQDVCYNAAVRRTHHPLRVVFPARAPTQLVADLEAFASGGSPPTNDGKPAAYEAGDDVDWRTSFASPRPHCDLPAYPWQRESFWPAGFNWAPRQAPAQPAHSSWLHRLVWSAQPRQAAAPVCDGTWFLVGDDGRLAASLRSRGGCVVEAPAEGERLVDLSGSCESILSLAQSMTPRQQLWLVTRGAQAVGGESALNPRQATVWGMARSLAREIPGMWRGVIDLDPRGGAAEMDMLLAELGGSPGGEVAFRRDERFVPNLESFVPDLGPEPRLDGTVMITGGLGGLGRTVARWLAARGVPAIVLVTRSDRDARASAFTDELSALGCQVAVVYADVSVEADLERVLGTIRREFPPLRGVFHAAGVWEDGPLAEQSWAAFQRVMAPKVHGAELLDRLSVNDDLRCFVLFSSAVALLGSAGQGGYGPANAYLDVLAAERRRQGRCALSIGWGPWSQVGMAAAAAERQLVEALPPEQGLEFLRVLLASGVSYAAVLPPAWRSFGAPTRSTSARPARETLPDDSRERHTALVAYIRDCVGDVLRVPAASLEEDESLIRQGLDSLTALELNAVVETDLQATIPMVELVAGASLHEIAWLLERELQQGPTELEDEPTFAEVLVGLHNAGDGQP